MFPLEFQRRMQRLLGPEYDAFAQSFESPRNVGLRLNPLKTGAPPPLDPFGLSPVAWAANGYYYNLQTRPGLSPYHDAGLYYLQEPSAMAPAQLLGPQPGERVLDLCAAPGGKSTQLAGAMAGRGLLCCNELVPGRAAILGRNIERLGIANALVLNEHPQRLAERFPGFFDRILVDAPCSGEGMFRKEDAAVRDWSEQAVLACAARQLEILSSAARMLRPGGRLVYSTCTFSPAENEGVIAAFLQTHPDFHIARVDAPWFSPGRPDWVRTPVTGLEHTFRLWPHKLRGEGHFAAVLTRGADAPADISEPELEPPAAPPAQFEAFMRELALSLPQGRLITFGQSLYLAPETLPNLRGLKVVRPCLELGQDRKNRFEPAHALAMYLKNAASVCDLGAAAPETLAYLGGQTLPGAQTGWTLVRADGLSLGWAKGSGGVLKNHLPKGLRRLG